MLDCVRTAGVIVIVAAMLPQPSPAETLNAARDQIVVGIVVVSAAAGAGVTFLILHQKHKTAGITGCIAAGGNGMRITDRKDKRIYAISGAPAGITAGHRMTLEGKRKRTDNGPAFEVVKVTQDLGNC